MNPSSSTDVNGCPNCGFHPNAAPAIDLHPPSSRITELLACNDAPRDSELSQIREIREDHARRVPYLEEEILRSTSSLERATRERERVLREIEAYRVVSSPIRRLPADIISEIFLTCRGEDTSNGDPPEVNSVDVTHMPWVLVQVCSRWRNLGTSESRLWSRISIDLDAAVSRRTAEVAFRLGLHLQRSGTTLLTVFLQSSIRTVPTGLLPVLLPSSYRWKTAAFVLDRKSLNRMSRIRGSLQALRTLKIEVTGPEDVPGMPATFDSFEFAPELRNFQVTSAADISSRWLVPWKQLTNYTWFDPKTQCAVPQHMDVLRRMHNLEECGLECGPSSNYAGPIITMEKLLDLHIFEANERASSNLTRHLVLPAVVDIFVEGVSSDFDSLVPLASLITRSHCHLTRLTTSLPDMDGDSLLQVLQVVPTLKWLSILEGGLTTEIANRMVFRDIDSESPLLPVLVHLTLAQLKFDVTLLVEMIESRVNRGVAANGSPVRALRRLELVAPLVALDPQLQSRLEQCRSLRFINGSNGPDAGT